MAAVGGEAMHIEFVPVNTRVTLTAGGSLANRKYPITMVVFGVLFRLSNKRQLELENITYDHVVSGNSVVRRQVHYVGDVLSNVPGGDPAQCTFEPTHEQEPIGWIDTLWNGDVNAVRNRELRFAELTKHYVRNKAFIANLWRMLVYLDGETPRIDPIPQDPSIEKWRSYRTAELQDPDNAIVSIAPESFTSLVHIDRERDPLISLGWIARSISLQILVPRG